MSTNNYMKIKINLILLTGAMCVGLLTANAADTKQPAGPKGGRLLEKTDPQAEFHVEKDRAITITFYDQALKPVPAAAQSVSVIAEAKEGKTKLEFEKQGDVLVSKSKLPAGDGYNLVVQLKSNADAKLQNYRFKLDLANCGGCNRAEYACICGH